MYYAKPIKAGMKKNAADEMKEKGALRVKELSRVLKGHYKRRDKSVLRKIKNVGLKDKEDMVVFCPLTDVQLRAYKRVIGSPDYQLLLRSKDTCECNRASGLTRGKCCHQTPHELEKQLGVAAVLWNAQHPEGEACKKCPGCMTLPCINKLQKLSLHLDLLKATPAPGGDGDETAAKVRSDRNFCKLALGPDLHSMGGVDKSDKFVENISHDMCGT
jgi:hypothetical protein